MEQKVESQIFMDFENLKSCMCQNHKLGGKMEFEKLGFFKLGISQNSRVKKWEQKVESEIFMDFEK